MSDYQTIIAEQSHYIGTITLNRPDKMNALNDQMLDEFYEAIVSFDKSTDIRAIIIKANGRAFCAGYDLSPREKPFETFQDWMGHAQQGNRLMRAIWESSTPIICQVQGHALGGGCDIVMASDFAIASENATFGEPEIQFNSHVLFNMMPYQIGMKRAKQILLTGDRFSASDAERFDLITAVVSAEELEETVLALARKLVKIPVPAMQINKATLRHTYETIGFDTTARDCERSFVETLLTETEESKEFYRISQEEGLAAAFKWRDALFADK